MADRLEADARTTKGIRSHVLSTYNDYKMRIKTSRNKIIVREHIS